MGTTATTSGIYAAIRSGFLEALGAKIADVLPWKISRKKKTKSKLALAYHNGAQNQKIKFLEKAVQSLVREMGRLKKDLGNCVVTRQECRTDLKNILLRVAAIENKAKAS